MKGVCLRQQVWRQVVKAGVADQPRSFIFLLRHFWNAGSQPHGHNMAADAPGITAEFKRGRERKWPCQLQQFLL